ncbi:hypothetical protein CR513_34834, partial [Mucuna pruriens]
MFINKLIILSTKPILFSSQHVLAFLVEILRKYANSRSLIMDYDKHNEIDLQKLLPYEKHMGSNNLVILIVLVYVNDLIVVGNNENVIEDFKRYFSICFYMIDLRNFKYFLGLEVARGPQGIFL